MAMHKIGKKTVALFALCTSSLLASNEPYGVIHEHFGPPGFDNYFGTHVKGSSDLNGDGLHEYMIQIQDGGTFEVKVYSGADHSVMHTFVSEHDYDYFGSALNTVEDINNDGVDDLIITATGNNENGSYAGKAYVYSGSDGALIHSWLGRKPDDQFGRSCASAGDVNNDGVDDVIIGAWNFGFNSHGKIWVYSGSDGSRLYAIKGGELDLFGSSVAGLGDLNGDGHSEFIVGALQGWDNTQGYANVYSGIDGSLMFHHPGLFVDAGHGAGVSALDDINDDGVMDYAVSFSDQGFALSSGVTVYSGMDGAKIYTVFADARFQHLGWDLCVVGDFDDDGYHDFSVRTGAFDDDYFRLYSGRDGSVLRTIDVDPVLTASCVGDVNGDSYPDIMIGEWLHNSAQGKGKVSLLSGFENALGTQLDCLQVSNGVSEISIASGGTQQMTLKASVTGNRYQYVLVGSETGTHAPGFQYQGVLFPLLYDYYFQLLFSTKIYSGFLDQNGEATIDFTVQAGSLPPSASGTQLHHSVMIIDTQNGDVISASTPTTVTLVD